MLNKSHLASLAMFASLTSVQSFAAAGNFPLTGNYQAAATQECIQLGFNSAQTVAIVSDDQGLTLTSGTAPASLLPVSSYVPTDGGPGHPFFNEFQNAVIGGYFDNNFTFKYAEGILDVLVNPHPTADMIMSGEIVFSLQGSALEVDSTSNPGSFTPAPKVSCVLQKI